MKKNIFSVLAVLGIAAIAVNAFAAGNTILVDAAAPGPTHDGLTATTAFLTIQAAIDDAGTTVGDTISIADGIYTISATIEVSKELTLQGTTQAGTIIDASGVTGGLPGQSFGPFGIHAGKSNLTFSNFTLIGPNPGGGGGRGFKLEGLTPSTTRATNLNITNVTVKNSKKTGIDINGVNNVTLTGVTSKDNGANGFSCTDCDNLVMTNFTSSGNPWGGVALYTKGVAYTGGINGVTITGQNSSETNPLYVQMEGSNPADPGNPYKVISVSAPQFLYTGTNSLNAGSLAYVVYGTDLTTVNNNATALGDAAHAKVKDTNGNTVLVPGQTIQSRIDAATAGDTIVVPAGSYIENLTINKALTLKGANESVNAVTGTRSAESILTGKILVTSGSVTIKGFKITNPAYTGSTIHGIQIFGNGPTISNVNISNNIISNVANTRTSPSVQGAYGIMIQADVSAVTIENNKIDSISSAGWARGIEVTPSCGVVGVPQSVIIRGNSISNIVDTAGTDAYNMSVDWCDSVPRIADASQITLIGNIFDKVSIKNLDTSHPLVITKNWWGSASPDFSTATGSVTSDPWCLQTGCTSYYTAPVVTPPTTSSGGGGIVTPVAQYFNGTTYVQGAQSGNTTIAPAVNVNSGQVLGASTFKFLTNLSYGSRGNDVTELQKILIANGYLKLKTGLPTGWFGPMTRAALKKWQQDKKIVPANGYFGPQSRNLMNK